MTPECRLCPNKVCVAMQNGRLINTNVEGKQDLDKIKMSEVKIEDCPIKELIEIRDSEDSDLELGC